MNPIVLEVHQDLDRDGWQDENGTIHYEDRVPTPYGILGSLKTTYRDGELVIIDAPDAILVRHGFPTAWSANTVGVNMVSNVYGYHVMEVTGINGTVKYQLDPRPVRWSDKDEPIPYYLAQLIACDVEFDAPV